MKQAQNMLRNIRLEGTKVGFKMNAKETDMMLFNQGNVVDIRSNDGSKINPVNNVKYLGEWMERILK